MHTLTAFERREDMSDSELDRLVAALQVEAERYRDAIRGYSPEKMERFGQPYLEMLEGRVAEAERVRARRRIA